ncbi:hypothetical protein [Micromonospora profundi]|uniref:hypothetical protein n=1 Tax=Micromonospora profundi TaxID=1420889 RepID=UPI003656449E
MTEAKGGSVETSRAIQRPPRPPVGGRGLQRHRPHVAQRLVADGETVVDVPARLSTRARAFATGEG